MVAPTSNQCGICRDGFADTDLELTLCGHAFHKHCFARYLSHEGQSRLAARCPMCRVLGDALLLQECDMLQQGAATTITDGEVLVIADGGTGEHSTAHAALEEEQDEEEPSAPPSLPRGIYYSSAVGGGMSRPR